MTERSEPRVMFAPDWRSGVPYQRLLGEALAGEGVRVSYLKNYRRIFPLWRLMRQAEPCDLLHLHWPEAYYPRLRDGWDWFRRARFPLDLWGSIRGRKLAVTAHNLHTHNRAGALFEETNMRTAFRLADVVFAHSEVAGEVLVRRFGLPAGRVAVIPHGDLSVVLGPPIPRAEARAQLGLGPEPLCLVFGAVEPYKGLEEIFDFWSRHRPEATLAVVGKPISPEYGRQIEQRAAATPGAMARLGWLDDPALRQWLSATDCVLFNYREIFTSGAANLARAYGLPQLLPARLQTVVLGEPHPLVFRFESPDRDLASQLRAALAARPDYAAAAGWRAETAWERVARITAQAYRRALGLPPSDAA